MLLKKKQWENDGLRLSSCLDSGGAQRTVENLPYMASSSTSVSFILFKSIDPCVCPDTADNS